MPRSAVAVVGASLALILPGCLGLFVDPYLLKPSSARAARTFDADLGAVADSMLLTLDEQGVKPTFLAIREAAADELVIQWDGKRAPEKNVEFTELLQVCRTRQAKRPDGTTKPFQAVLINYRGKSKDGRPVVVTAFVDPKERSRTNFYARVGTGGDHAGGDALADGVARHLPGDPPVSPAPASDSR